MAAAAVAAQVVPAAAPAGGRQVQQQHLNGLQTRLEAARQLRQRAQQCHALLAGALAGGHLPHQGAPMLLHMLCSLP